MAKAFCGRVGWRVKTNWLLYNDLKFNLLSPKGHLPVWGYERGYASLWGGWGLGDYIFSRMETCSLFKRYAIIIEKAEGNYCAYVPDLPECVVTGYTIEEVKKEIKEAIIFHLKGLEIEGLPIPQPTAISEYVEV